jgi:hypothetical protein
MDETHQGMIYHIDTGDEVAKIVSLIVGWYIAIFQGVLVQVIETEPVVRAVIGILLALLMSVSIPRIYPFGEANRQNLVLWLEAIMIILTMLFGIVMFGAAMEEMGYPMAPPLG